ncbi:acyl carrier protein [Pseudomonas syringae pv. syringae]|uniref:Acyl carrier protein n=2 Tax=Pseudomonas fragariae (ex Marin et al. 2024) TaxID=3080056 RepID=A0ABT3LND5_9PSED|nr:acyl carrier protein [Pseudomonas syringae pv. syringae]MCA5969394.1 acyl carrier protein [Pseudomonas sp. P129]MCF5184325.1 acyl carrier protein [Pseudomonas syringae]MCW6057945.1 acyl carrier protein [Pseudomonas fragi]MCF5316468.1 acyl carrier protein [Pseudomonas syringae]
MIMVDVMTRVKELVAEHLEAAQEDVKPTSDITKDLKGSSLEIVELGMALEEEFNIKIPDENFEKFKTVQNIVDYISKNKK